MEFEWDENKRDINVRKHDIDFADARDMWRGQVIDPYDSPIRDGEQRHLALGTIGGDEDSILIAVVYTWRGGVRRLISARKADRHERADYAGRA